MKARTVTTQAELDRLLAEERRPNIRMDAGTFHLSAAKSDPRKATPRIALLGSARLALHCDAGVTGRDQSVVCSWGGATLELEDHAMAIVLGDGTVYADDDSQAFVEGDVIVNATGRARVFASAARVIYLDNVATASARAGINVVAHRDGAVLPFDAKAFDDAVTPWRSGGNGER